MDGRGDLGLEEGATVVDRKFCIEYDLYRGHPRFDVRPRPSWDFEEWAARAEAMFEARVSAVTGGFDPHPTSLELQVTLSVRRHLFEPEHQFADELHVLMEHGEFVAGDAVFCGRPWGTGGYRPRVGDIWIVGAFVPTSEYWSHSVLFGISPDQVFVVPSDTGELRRGGGASWPSTDTFPTSLEDFVNRVNAMSLAGGLDLPSPWEVANAIREREEYERRIRRWTSERAGREARNLATKARRQCYALAGQNFNENGHPTKPVLEAYLQAMRNCDRRAQTDMIAMSCPNGLFALGVGDPRIGGGAVEARPASTKWQIDGAVSWSSQWLVSDGWLFEPDEKDVDRFIRTVRAADRNSEIVFSTIQNGGGTEYEGRVSVQSTLDVIDEALERCTGDRQ